MASIDKTLAMKLLDGKKVAYETAVYPAGFKDAVEVAAQINAPPEQVFKTLVVLPPEARSKPMLVMVPAQRQLELKKLAKAVNAKKLKMASQREAEEITGLQVGGISALALLNKGFAVYLDESARRQSHVYVSAGQRGIQIKLAVDDLIRLTRARIVDASA